MMRKLLVALLLFASTLSGVLSVQDFTCNSGLLNTQVNVPFNCVTTILNDDVSADAALNTVTLSSLEGWTSANSYSGSFSGNSVPRGGTTSVTFSGITAVSPGSGRKFSDILINGGSGNSAKLADALLNVVAIKSSSASASATTAAYASEFTVLATTDLGGQANLTARIELSGCTLSSGQSSARNFGVVSDTAQSTSWKVTQASYSGGSCTASVEFRAVAEPVTVYETKTVTVAGSGTPTATPTPTPTPSSSQVYTVLGSTSSAPGTGAGPGGSASEQSLFEVFSLPKALELEPGVTETTQVTLSSHYTGFLRNVNITLTGIPKDWYTIKPVDFLTPISNTSFTIDWRIPSDARGTHDVRLEISGVGTKTAGLLKTVYEFKIVLPPAKPTKPSKTVVKTGRRLEATQPPEKPEEHVAASSLLEPVDKTNYQLVLAVIVLTAGALAMYHYLTRGKER